MSSEKGRDPTLRSCSLRVFISEWQDPEIPRVGIRSCLEPGGAPVCSRWRRWRRCRSFVDQMNDTDHSYIWTTLGSTQSTSKEVKVSGRILVLGSWLKYCRRTPLWREWERQGEGETLGSMVCPMEEGRRVSGGRSRLWVTTPWDQDLKGEKEIVSIRRDWKQRFNRD